MSRPGIVLLVALVALALVSLVSLSYSVDGGRLPSQWQVTSVKVCRDLRGNLDPHILAPGTYPVYSFFIPRPVWTVNGSGVEAQPIYEQGRLTAYRLLWAARLLNSGTKNSVKFSLPDQNGSKVFRYDHDKVKPGECYEFF